MKLTKLTLVFLAIAGILLMGCEKTSDELRAEKSAAKQFEKNRAGKNEE